MREVEDVLVVGVGVHGRHEAFFYDEVLVKHLGYRREAVRGAGGVRDDVVFFRVVEGMIDSHAKGNVFVLCRSRYYDLLRARVKVPLCLVSCREKAGAFERYVNAEFFPRELRRVSFCRYLDLSSVDKYAVRGGLDRAVEPAVYGIVFKKMREGLGVRDVVYGDEVYLFVVNGGAKHVPADSAEAVYCDLYSHFSKTSEGFYSYSKREISPLSSLRDICPGAVKTSIEP